MLHILFGWLIPINRIWLLWGGDWNPNPKKVFPRHDVPIQGWASYYPSIAAAWGAQSGCPTGCWHLQPHGSQPAKSWWHTDEPSGIGLQAVVQKKNEKPPATWNLHLIGRGPSDSASAYPTLDSNVKAAHVKPILFFLAEISSEISSHCTCPLAVTHM